MRQCWNEWKQWSYLIHPLPIIPLWTTLIHSTWWLKIKQDKRTTIKMESTLLKQDPSICSKRSLHSCEAIYVTRSRDRYTLLKQSLEVDPRIANLLWSNLWERIKGSGFKQIGLEWNGTGMVLSLFLLSFHCYQKW